MTGEEFLVEVQKAGLLNAAAVNKVRREALIAGEEAETIIARQQLVEGQKLAELRSHILKIPYKKVNLDDLDEKLMDIIPEETARNYGVVPLSRSGNLLVLGMLKPDDMKAQEAVKFIARSQRLNLGVYVISYDDWQAALRKYSPYRTEIEHAIQSLNLKPGAAALRSVGLEEGGAAGEAPIVRIVADTLKEAVQSRASDVHIEPQEKYLRVRFRIDGTLKEVASLPIELAQPIVSRIKVISSLKLDETRIPQDGRFRSRVVDREIDFRVSTFPTPLGEKVALRVLDPTIGLRSFDSLGLVYRNYELVEEGLRKPFGMILMTGPTGSGKTTTLYAMLQKLNDDRVNIISLEDPVEYFIPGVNQSQVHPEIGYDFASGLRQILRQDPDIIMVGEVRDNEAASLAVQAALTGHIVLSTLHTNNAVGVIPRLIDMKVEPFLLPVSLNLMLSQRLVGLLCPDCKSAEVAAPAAQKIIKKALGEVPAEIAEKFKEPYRIYRSRGCPKCKGRGMVGRTALYEAFQMTAALEEVISSGPTFQKILREAKNQGMLTLRQDGVVKALEGLVSLEEVTRETEDY